MPYICILSRIRGSVQKQPDKGGDWDNAIVIVEHPVTKEQVQHLAKLFNKPAIEVKPEGILNNLELRFHNEPARHKLLDVIGDLALCGMPLKGRVTAVCPGHMSNTELAKILRKKIRDLRNNPLPPKYDPLAEPIYDINRIKRHYHIVLHSYLLTR